MSQCIPPADIRLLFLKHCSLCTQQEATKSALTRAVGPLLMTQLIKLLTTTSAVCCPMKGPGAFSPPGLELAWSPLCLLSAYPWLFQLPWQELKSHLQTFWSSADPGPMRTDPRGQCWGQVESATAADGIRLIIFLIAVLLPLPSLFLL